MERDDRWSLEGGVGDDVQIRSVQVMRVPPLSENLK
jgi:hypothetical protein